MSLSNFWGDARKPFNLVMMVVTAVSLVFGLFGLVTWYWSQQVAEISYKIVQIPVVNTIQVQMTPHSGVPEPSPSFTVLDNKGQPINTNIYAAEIAVWNTGDLELGPSKVRRPLTVKIGGDVHILDNGVSRITDPIAEVVSSEISKNTIEVRWKYLDPGTAFRVRIIYTSEMQQDLTLSANVLGVGPLIDLDSNQRGWKYNVRFGILLITGVVFGLGYIFFLQHLPPPTTSPGKIALLSYVVFFGGVGLLFLLVWGLGQLLHLFPPQIPI
jgi:hypothetical protein